LAAAIRQRVEEATANGKKYVRIDNAWEALDEFENKDLAGSTIQVNSKSGVHYFADITSGNPVDISPFNIDELTVGAYAIIRSSTTAEPVVNNNADSKPVEKIGYTDFVLDELSGKVIDIIIEIKPFAVEVSYRYVKD